MRSPVPPVTPQSISSIPACCASPAAHFRVPSVTVLSTQTVAGGDATRCDAARAGQDLAQLVVVVDGDQDRLGSLRQLADGGGRLGLGKFLERLRPEIEPQHPPARA